MIDINSFLLFISILVPFFAGILMFFTESQGKSFQRALGLLGFLVPAIISLWLAYQYTNAEKITDSYAFFSNSNTGLQNFGISLKLGLNGISLPMYLLAGIVSLAAGIYAINSRADRLYLYLALLLLMQAGLMGAFAAIDIFFFYFFHELALIPTFIMIGIWGGRGRSTVAMELTVYLTLGAMLSLMGLIAIYMQSGLGSFDLITLKKYLASKPISEFAQNNIFALLMFGFGILVSLFPFHSWAPRAYGVAPTSAAMLHAGVLKKFGLYGLIQIAAPLLPSGATSWVMLLALLALGNVLFIGFVTIAQRDLKQMIGFSSVMHMGYCFLGIACLSTMGIGAAVVLMFAHGLSVALLFLLGHMIYERTETFEMNEMGGLSQKAPVLAGFFLAAILSNVGLPGFANFWGEIGIFISLWKFQPWMVFLAVTGIIIAAIYGLRAMASIFLGEPTDVFKERFERGDIVDITIKEKIPALVLLVALIVVGFFPSLITKPLNRNLYSINETASDVVPYRHSAKESNK